MRHLPNLICVFRIILVWPFVVALNDGRHVDALLLFAIAALSDGLDGFLAKRFNWQSELGKALDPLADKILLVAAFIVMTWLGYVPAWLTVAVVARDVTISVGAIIYRFWFGPLHGRPTIISKINTLLQILVVVSALLRAAAGFPPVEIITALAWLTLVTTLISGVDYVGRFVRRAWDTPARAS